MKSGKRPTRKQKDAIRSVRLNPDNWLVTKNLSEELHLVHRYTNKPRVIKI
jgi:hypothetical protein